MFNLNYSCSSIVLSYLDHATFYELYRIEKADSILDEYQRRLSMTLTFTIPYTKEFFGLCKDIKYSRTEMVRTTFCEENCIKIGPEAVEIRQCRRYRII